MVGKTPSMNALAAELGLRLQKHDISMTTEHYRGELNVDCDALSRLAQGHKIPEHLLCVERVIPPERDHNLFWAWPREILQTRT